MPQLWRGWPSDISSVDGSGQPQHPAQGSSMSASRILGEDTPAGLQSAASHEGLRWPSSVAAGAPSKLRPSTISRTNSGLPRDCA